MRWTRMGVYHSVSDAGYCISAAGMGDGVWKFTAWGPERAIPAGALKARYVVGEQVPQRREHLGVGDTMREAMLLCEQDRGASHAAC